ncbi:MAG: hypothetical protein LJE67_00220 [Salaquimonas sp.]|nr:hypothetical protein [Salaquimonas sp.]
MTRSGLAKTCLVLALLAGGIGTAAHSALAADSAGQFLEKLAGEFRGRGTASLPGRDTPEKVSCKISNSYDAATKALVVKGNCASTQAKTTVSGKMVYDGDKVSGSLFTSGESIVTKSSGSVKGEKLTVSTNFSDKVSGKLTRTLQVIRSTSRGFDADFFIYNSSNGKFERAGSIKFTGS